MLKMQKMRNKKIPDSESRFLFPEIEEGVRKKAKITLSSFRLIKDGAGRNCDGLLRFCST